MKIGIISDIEGNHKNLETVLHDLTDCRYIFNLGDSVGEKGDSDTVIEILKKNRFKSISGNHDLELILHKSVAAEKFLVEMLQSSNEMFHPKISLKEENLSYIRNLKMLLKAKFSDKRIACCHSLYGYKNNDLYFEYVNFENADALFDKFKSDITFVGHSHIPVVIMKNGNTPPQIVKIKKSISFKMESGVKYIINPGSIGAPRKKNIKYSYAVLDTDNLAVSLVIE